MSTATSFRLTDQQRSTLDSIVTPHLSDNLDRLSGIKGLRHYHRHRKLIGTALTVRCRPGDNLYIYQALTMLEPGQVLVVDGAGHEDNALVGELIMLYAQQRGCAGFVIDGAIRDITAFKEHDFPCYARSHIHRGPYKHGPGEVNVPVSVGGQVIHPGDILVGDEDGVVSFAPEQLEPLIRAARLSAQKEETIKQEIATGEHHQRWLNAVLLAQGIEYGTLKQQ
ncbi:MULTISPECIES: RraA family protein [Halomonas]|uniref:RraA family protein n=1 Tax=Halomonas TaxID=2745 RepID=UPI001C980959|nr:MULTISPECIES: RraA family protein [Halomonas]MBY6207950.1 RraA family protein [Halomonas sp. DP3Y7-2]MBY6228759.1 RraA family protein [Halomonas sp. DP3Y7-1]MCA0917257.1 RraA family protein [Halomonas denitrificans]